MNNDELLEADDDLWELANAIFCDDPKPLRKGVRFPLKGWPFDDDRLVSLTGRQKGITNCAFLPF